MKRARMQPHKFGSVEEMLDFLPEDELEITEFLRSIIFDAIPEVQEKLSFNVPFFKRNKGLCYLWPGAVYWGQSRSYGGVEFGFNQGHLLSDPDQILQRGKRKQVFFMRIEDVKEIDAKQIRSYLFEAVMIDDEMKKRKGS